MRSFLLHGSAWLLGLTLLAGCAKETPEPVAPAPKSSATADLVAPKQPSCPDGGCGGGIDGGMLDEVVVTGTAPSTGGGSLPYSSPTGTGANGGGYNGGSGGVGGGGGYGGSGSNSGTTTQGTAINYTDPLTMGDWSKVCTLRSYGPTRIDIKVVVEITKKTHTLEKLTVFHSGTLPPGSKLEQLGDGTNLGYNAANNTYDFGVRFQVTNFDGSLNSKAELLLGTVNLNNNSYVLRIAK